MTKSELQGFLNRINAFTSWDPEKVDEYCAILKQCVEKLQVLQQEDKNPMLEAWLNMGLQEIRREYNERFSNVFENMDREKQKTEFMYSRSIVTMALTNILMYL